MSNYCPKCCSKLKCKTYWHESLGYLGILDCPSNDFIFTSAAEYSFNGTDGFDNRQDARKGIINEFNRKYNPSKVLQEKS